jgi:hypothetical protein
MEATKALRVSASNFRHFRLGQRPADSERDSFAAELRAVLDRPHDAPGHLEAVSARQPLGAL